MENLANHMTYKFSSIYFFVPLIISTMAIREIFLHLMGNRIFPECQQTIEVTNKQKKIAIDMRLVLK